MINTQEDPTFDLLDSNEMVRRIAKKHYEEIIDQCKPLKRDHRAYILGRIIQMIYIEHFQLMIGPISKELDVYERKLKREEQNEKTT